MEDYLEDLAKKYKNKTTEKGFISTEYLVVVNILASIILAVCISVIWAEQSRRTIPVYKMEQQLYSLEHKNHNH